MNAMQSKVIRWFSAATAVAILAGCSSGGAPTVVNPITEAPPVNNYIGPAAANADVQAFRLNLWDNIKANNRCGSCHGAGGQTPMFARNDDVNLAYQAANTIVNLTQPDQSRMVAKVAGGHNCWLQSPSACGDTLTVWIRNWAGSSATGGTQIQLQAPVIREVGGSKSFPASSALFAESSLYELVRTATTANCVRCHSSNSAVQQQPFFAEGPLAPATPTEEAIETAYAAIKSKINLDNPATSRLVLRLRDEFHNCWGNAGCGINADTMQAAVQEFADLIPISNVPPGLLISKGLTLYDGTVAAGGNRYEAATIAKYEFKTGMGGIAYDTSGHEPALSLTLSGDVTWVGGWGINIKAGGKAQGSASASKKLADLIKSTGEFTIEAWVNNANVAQEDAYIVSYSAGTDFRNATLAQQMYQYEGYTRSDRTNGNGTPPLQTRAADMDAQAALQHVVMTFSPVEGRRIYVNGMYTGDADARGGGSLADWDDTFALVLGNETSSDRQWEGVMRMVAIHNRALTPTQILQNFDAGVGEKYFMLFNVSHLLPEVPQAYIMLEATQLDSYGLQFTKPTFISLAPNVTVPNVPIAGLRIGVNGGELRAGQAYVPLNTAVTAANYTAGAGQELSRVGTVAAIDKNIVEDVFFLSFERIGALSHDPDDPPEPTLPPPADLEPESDVGLRTFDEINATLSQITRVPMINARVRDTYTLVKQALPSIEKFGAFGPAQQTALAQLAMQYCNVMVDDNGLRASFFGSLDGSGTGAAVFGTSASPNTANRNLLITALMTKAVGAGMDDQVTEAQIRAELLTGFYDPAHLPPDPQAEEYFTPGLVNRLVDGPTGNNAAGGRTVMKAACGAVLGSGATLIQ
ncbi:MAG TPA: LamG domain-containing protein [Steroidobacteraceae bacterium]|nr:LamG domain-containing protein [Steroidobacteraceae bacterium]